MRKFQVITLFPEMFTGVFGSSMMWKAQKDEIVELSTIDLRQFGIGPRKTVDDIPYGGGDGMLLKPEPLFAADLLPVCAPKLAASLKRPGDLKGQSLLRVAHASEDWPLWLNAAGATRISARGTEFQYYGQALQAASDGLGVAMGIRPYIDDDLAAGRLVAPFALSVPKGMRWYLLYRSFRTEQRDFAAFRRWIIQAAAGPARAKVIGRIHRNVR